MNRFDSMVSRDAWESLVQEYDKAGGANASDNELAELLRNKMLEVEGI